MRPNVLFVTLDQFRGDSLSCAGHPLVRTPNLDAIAAQGVRLGRHYAQAAPCAPGRAALYTGTYQMTNRVVANGTPLDFRLGVGQVISGWDTGVQGMKVGGRRKLVIPPHLGYGDRGAGGVIKPGETLIFVVDLMGVR